MIDVAIDAAKEAGALAYRYFKTQPKVSYKVDNTPVTRADIEAEKLIRKIITKNFPDHGIIGEELPPVNPKAKYQWVIDPIDGTRDFVRSIPAWGTFIALMENGKPTIGVYFDPPRNELFAARKGKGTYLNSQKTKVSKVSDLSKACVCHGSIRRFKNKNKLMALIKICQIAHHSRDYSTYSLNLLLKGNIDVYIEAGGGLHDFAATSLLVEEAGGKFTDFAGKFSLTSNEGIYSNGLLHTQVLKILNAK